MFKITKSLSCRGIRQLISPCPLSPRLSRARPWQSAAERHYATAQGFSGNDFSWPTKLVFTPYDVFKQDPKAPYSKHRFYELVKIYHPDRSCNDHPLCKELSPDVRLQRYHLLVAAHDILSDPVKRAAYDRSGEGWSLHPTPNPTPSWAQSGSRDYGPIHTNATWEDWERWHNRHQEKQKTVVDNRTFTMFLVLIIFMGGAVQLSWFGQLTSDYEERLREVNEKSSKFLAGRRENTVKQMASSEARVQDFLIRRDPSGYGLKEEEQPVYQKILNPPKPASAQDEGTHKPKTEEVDTRA